MYRKLTPLLLLILVLSLMLSACQPSTPAIPMETATEEPVVEATEEPVAEATEEPAATEAPTEMAGCPPSTLADPMGISGAFPQQFELAEFEEAAGCELTFTDNPMFAADVAAGKLPPVEERLPAEPLVVQPYNEIGKYGGTLRGISLAPSSGTTEFFASAWLLWYAWKMIFTLLCPMLLNRGMSMTTILNGLSHCARDISGRMANHLPPKISNFGGMITS